VTDKRLRELRRLVRNGELPGDLVDDLRAIVRRVARGRLLPPSFAPYGQWDEEAADELFASWYADRLLSRSDLLALLDRAATVGAFHRLAERSLRQHMLNARDRSQAQNLFRRLVVMLGEDDAFRRTRDAVRPQDCWYVDATADPEPDPWTGGDRLLIAQAWSLGDFVVIRYRAAANKLSPVLDTGDLHRFAHGLLQRTAAALTPSLIMHALSARFDLGAVDLVPHDDEVPTPSREPSPADDVLLRDTARAALAGLSPRQVEVLRRTGTEAVADIAAALGCSVGTVINEQRRIGEVVTRLSEDDDERDRILNIAADLLYVDNDE
jgi:DNA-binding CsgD family transcriptional regulator